MGEHPAALGITVTHEPTGALRIAVVHSFYSSRQPSGENVVVELQVEALRRAGHEVLLVDRSTDELEQAATYPLRAGLRAATGRGDSPLAEIEAHRPDVVHIHNLFPNLGRRWVERLKAPLVTTLHNYRPICPAGTLFRDGASCTLCPDSKSARPAVTHSCFKGSRAQTLPVAIGTRFAEDPLLRRADRIVTLHDNMLATYAHYGVPEDRLVTVPNFVPPRSERAGDRTDTWLFVGRLTYDKGIIELLTHWPADRELVVVGAGPQEDEARALAGDNVTFLGQLPGTEVSHLMASVRGLAFPSLWPEGLPTVYLEALAAGLPVIAWPQSIVGTLVARDRTGIVTAGDLPAELERADREFPSLGEHCREVYDRLYSEQAWVSAITDVYRSVVTSR
ncbi:glycosyltransferase involved in cell wall biosynthesis [Aeromicrobium panaciterrae]|uniref:Glycosyltransferase involved in cell wall biosynthesis n=1 Tax=Aeromicrobium panaciterrae TaxID=363861 RepID=A0ABU1UKL9_9ACTN|nr:glycosyltransferase family 4 protein [Aeromicrobium panaciterrae]MDR7085719.1 glycosyltransferase involved in cell wall biosynthesis [Aeromicrobium panaciterrae]